MNKETYLKLPNITVGELQNVIDYLDENNIKYIEYYEEEHKLEQALDEIENYLKGAYEMATYSKSFMLDKDNVDELLDIINKAKGNDE